ncbi:MAG: leucine-rich repeat domain-containing protein [Prevotella sp.]|nr:leucine-rich repeat domain-containing protein [Prevotella sp.]
MDDIFVYSEDSKTIIGLKRSDMSTLTIPEGVVKIDYKVLADCKKLQTIALPNSLDSFGSFDGCDNLRSISVESDNIKYLTEDGVLYNKDKTKLIRVPQNIQKNVFEVPNGVATIWYSAFSGTSIRRIRIPKGVSVIDDYCFSGCNYLETIDVDKDNPNYSSEKGILMNKERNRILCYPYNKDISHLVIPDGVWEINIPGFRNYAKLGKLRILEIPQSIESIPDNYFKDCVNLQSVIISEGVTHIGEHSFANCRKLREITIPGSVKTIGKGAFENCLSLSKVTIAEGTTAIGEEAFKNCKSLKSVSFANSVVEIGKASFSFCVSLEKLDLPKGLQVITDRLFWNCESLDSIDIPEGVKEIGGQAFADCKKLNNVTIPDSVTKLSKWAFYGCSLLQTVIIPKGIREIEHWSFFKCSSLNSITIPQGVTIIEDAFSECTSLIKICFPDSIESINNSSFNGCSSLQSIQIAENNSIYTSINGILYSKDKSKLIKAPEGLKSREIVVPKSVTEIDNSAFRDMVNVVDIKLPDGLAVIGNCAFYGCRSLEKLHLPGSVCRLGKKDARNIFMDCSSLSNISVDERNGAFASINGILFDKAMTKLIKMPANCGVEHYSIPDSVIEIVSNAFDGCHSLKCIELTDNIIKIGSGAFRDCISLQTIEIPNSVIELGSSAFEGCSALQEIEIPNSISLISDSIFSGCSSLQSIDIPNSVKNIGVNAFKGCISLHSIDIPQSVLSFGFGSFENCSSLKSVEIPNVNIIKHSVFDGCSSLHQINIPRSVTKIENFAFHNSGLEEVILSSNVEEIGDHAFCNNPIKQYVVEKENKSFFANDGVLYQRVSARWGNEGEIESYEIVKYPEQKQEKTYVVDDKTIWIGSCAFKHAENLEEICLCDEINSMGQNAFASCKSLKKIALPKNLKNVNKSAFYDCVSLEEIYLTSIREIYSEAFSGCVKLKSIHLYCDDANLVNVSPDAFNCVDTETCVLYVPSGSRWSYRHHQIFGMFKNIVIER